VAVAVEQDEFLVLDDEFRIVEVGAAARATFGPLLGKRVFDAFPDSEALFRPYYEHVRETGVPTEFATFYDGVALHLRVAPADGDLLVTWRTLARLDVLTIDGLAASLDHALAAIANVERELQRVRGRDRLRIVGEP
jgi:hypothetical protein